jgi:hypothetical protein
LADEPHGRTTQGIVVSSGIEPTFADAIEWARGELCHTDFGEVRLGFIMHDGRLRRIEKIIVLKEQPVERRTGERL